MPQNHDWSPYNRKRVPKRALANKKMFYFKNLMNAYDMVELSYRNKKSFLFEKNGTRRREGPKKLKNGR